MILHLLIGAGILALCAWLYLWLGHGGFWNIGRQLPPKSDREREPVSIAAIIPARNEREVIGRSLTSLLAESAYGPIPVFLVDDGSSDGTAQAAIEAARATGREHLLTVISGAPLPPGWSGKLWALRQGIEQASRFHLNTPTPGVSGTQVAPNYFLLTDADIVHSPEDLSDLIALARRGEYDLASLMVRLHCRSLPEKLLIPSFVFFFFQLYPPAWISSIRHRTAGAAGGCVLIRPEALQRAGGLEAVRDRVIDDCALAALIKHAAPATGAPRGRVWLGAARASASIRETGTFAGIGRMISRTAFHQLRHSSVLLLAALIGLGLIYVLPPLLLLAGGPMLHPNTLKASVLGTPMLGAAAWLLMTITYLPFVRYYRLNPLWALSLPLAALIYGGATLHSALKYWMGRGGEWKGRIQDPGKIG